MGVFVLDQTITPIQTLGVGLVMTAMIGFAVQKKAQ
jgi:threonine/homoserine efflux transporter RhtA